MNVRKCLILILFIFIPFFVEAEDDFGITCPKEILIGSQVNCSLTLASQANIKGIMANYEFNEVFSYLDTKFVSSWDNEFSNNKGFTIINTDGFSNGNVADLNLVLSDSGVIGNEYKIGLNNIVLSDGEKDIFVANKENILKVLSVNNIVDSIFVNDVKLEVKDGIAEYTVDVDNIVSNVNLFVSLKDENKYRFVENYGSRSVSGLKVGTNVYQIKIVGLDGFELINYTFNIVRKDVEKESVDNMVDNSEFSSFSIIIIVITLLIMSLLILKFYKKFLRRSNDAEE